MLPFIDAERLVDTSRKLVTNDKLSTDEISRNQVRDALVYTRDEKVSEDVPALNERRNFGALVATSVRNI